MMAQRGFFNKLQWFVASRYCIPHTPSWMLKRKPFGVGMLPAREKNKVCSCLVAADLGLPRTCGFMFRELIMLCRLVLSVWFPPSCSACIFVNKQISQKWPKSHREINWLAVNITVSIQIACVWSWCFSHWVCLSCLSLYSPGLDFM